MEWTAIIPILLVCLPLAGGYFTGRTGLAEERLARTLMTFVVVFGYPAASLFSIWGMRLSGQDFWLPALGGLSVVAMAGVGMVLGRIFAREHADRGLIAISVALGNSGVTMGGLVLNHLYGAQGLGLMGMYCLMWTPLTVLVAYPLARHYSDDRPGLGAPGLARLIVRSIFDWRSIGLPVSVVAILLAVWGVPAPGFVARWRVLDVVTMSVTAAAYFAIGLRLRPPIGGVWKTVGVVGLGRLGLGLVCGLVLAWATLFTPWPLTGMTRSSFVIESFVPTAVTMVGVCNMFNVKPREASLVFVLNTLTYMLIVLPVVLWVCK